VLKVLYFKVRNYNAVLEATTVDLTRLSCMAFSLRCACLQMKVFFIENKIARGPDFNTLQVDGT